jgi:membrane-associated phospholipid phosphatase
MLSKPSKGQFFLISISFICVAAICFLTIDPKIALTVQQYPLSSHLAYIMQSISHLGSGKPWVFVLGIMWLLLAIIKTKHHQTLVHVTLSCTIAIMLKESLKFLLARYRPEMLPLGHYGFHFFSEHWRQESMPSGHTTRTFALAFSLLQCQHKKIGLIAATIAGLVGMSRIFVNAHYLSDIIMGIYVAWVATLIAWQVAKK